MRCPICKKEVAPDERHMPFCSERCRIIDLGNWASEKYIVSAPIADETQSKESGEGENEK